MDKKELINLGVQKYLNGEGTLTELQKELKIKKEEIKLELERLGYIIKRGYKLSTVIGLKKAVDKYLKEIDNEPSISKISKEFNIDKATLSNRLKELGIEIINHQNKLKFDETIFDSIDTEEKAYWLGFIYADGYISSKDNSFEISLQESDYNHLEKFNIFSKHIKNNVSIREIKSNNQIYKKCTWTIRNTHLHDTLNNYGCVPNKSLILQFPNINIFKSKELIKHFIRGYWDGDGCLTYGDKEHNHIQISVLGTEDFLTKLKENLPLKFDYVLGYNNKKQSLITRTLQLNGKNAFEICKYLYEDATVYLDRKYERYKEYCRLYEKLYRGLEGKNGEGCDANTVLNSEISQGSESV